MDPVVVVLLVNSEINPEEAANSITTHSSHYSLVQTNKQTNILIHTLLLFSTWLLRETHSKTSGAWHILSRRCLDTHAGLFKNTRALRSTAVTYIEVADPRVRNPPAGSQKVPLWFFFMCVHLMSACGGAVQPGSREKWKTKRCLNMTNSLQVEGRVWIPVLTCKMVWLEICSQAAINLFWEATPLRHLRGLLPLRIKFTVTTKKKKEAKIMSDIQRGPNELSGQSRWHIGVTRRHFVKRGLKRTLIKVNSSNDKWGGLSQGLLAHPRFCEISLPCGHELNEDRLHECILATFCIIYPLCTPLTNSPESPAH